MAEERVTLKKNSLRRALALQKGWNRTCSLKGLARMLHVPTATLAAWGQARTRPLKAQAEHLASILGCSLGDLIAQEREA